MLIQTWADAMLVRLSNRGNYIYHLILPPVMREVSTPNNYGTNAQDGARM